MDRPVGRARYRGPAASFTSSWRATPPGAPSSRWIRPRHVVFTWGIDGDEKTPYLRGPARSRSTSWPRSTSTLVTLTHRDLPEDYRASHQSGWRTVPHQAEFSWRRRADRYRRSEQRHILQSQVAQSRSGGAPVPRPPEGRRSGVGRWPAQGFEKNQNMLQFEWRRAGLDGRDRAGRGPRGCPAIFFSREF